MPRLDRTLLGPASLILAFACWAGGVYLQSLLPPIVFGLFAVMFFPIGALLAAAAFLPASMVESSPLSGLRHWLRASAPSRTAIDAEGAEGCEISDNFIGGSWDEAIRLKGAKNTGARRNVINSGGGAVSIGQRGGITANTVNIGPQRFRMTPARMDSVADQLGEPREIEVHPVGSEQSKVDASRLAAWLRQRGFAVTLSLGTMILAPPLSRPIELRGNVLYVDSDKHD